MGVMLQVRNLSEDVHAVLKARAKAAGLSLSDYVAQELGKIAEQATLEEAFARLQTSDPVETGSPDAEADDIVSLIRDDRGPLPDDSIITP
ncbi:FitA-like ribbon-helix-helix domain-containing protein [Plantibacter sp. Mn2098]|uniref:FitA-like ribbon-helix-helix domain-containing protein n=1 Tax=Plantibacter sp. Mn2098 TaxID=3395266 RepID=UPI003BD134AA